MLHALLKTETKLNAVYARTPTHGNAYVNVTTYVEHMWNSTKPSIKYVQYCAAVWPTNQNIPCSI